MLNVGLTPTAQRLGACHAVLALGAMALALSSTARAQSNDSYRVCLAAGVDAATCERLVTALEAPAAPAAPVAVAPEQLEPTPNAERETPMGMAGVSGEATQTQADANHQTVSDINTQSNTARATQGGFVASGDQAVETALASCASHGIGDQDCGIFYREVFAGQCLSGQLRSAICESFSKIPK